MISFDITWAPNPALVAQQFFMAADKISDLRQPMEEAIEAYAEDIARNFQEQGRPQRWEELSEWTLRKRGLLGKVKLAATLMGSGERTGFIDRQGAEIEVGQSRAKTSAGMEIAGKLLGSVQILVDTRDLITSATDPGAWSISSTPGGRDTVAMLVDIPTYGHFHLTGTGAPSYMPARDWAYIDPDTEEYVDDIFLNHMMEAFGEV